MTRTILLAAIGCAVASAVAPTPVPAADGLLPGGPSSPLSVTGEIQQQIERDRLQFQQQGLDSERLRTQFDLERSRRLKTVDPTFAGRERAQEERLMRLDRQERALTDRLWRLDQPPVAPSPRFPPEPDPDAPAGPAIRPAQEGSSPMAGSDEASEEARRYVEALLNRSRRTASPPPGAGEAAPDQQPPQAETRQSGAQQSDLARRYVDDLLRSSQTRQPAR